MNNMSNKNYTILHLHSMLSNGVTNIDSVTTYEQYIKQAHKWGMKAMAFSEHGSVFHWIKKKLCMEELGMKYIHAEEFYLTSTLSEKIRDNYHCLLIAKNYDGVLELNKLSSISFNRDDNHFYYVPRITLEDVKNTSDNIIVSTACLAGVLNKAPNDIKQDFIKFLIKNKHRCFLEIQPHLDEEQIRYNQELYRLHKKYDINLVLCTDTHALNPTHVKGRSILQKAKDIHFDGEDLFHLEMLKYDDLIDLCKKQNAFSLEIYLEAIENTNKIADMIEEFEINYDYKYPHLWGEDSEKVLREKIKDGLINRGINKLNNYQEYLNRIEYEMKAYIHNDAIDFMLLMEDIAHWCKENDIEIGYGRGSCNGSIIAYLLGITEMDSIKHNLNFDRFMNVERVSLSDIDTDFPPSRINEVKEYIFNKHGLYCADIVTFNTIALKGAIRDVGRALEIPLNEVNDICNNVELNYDDLREKYPQLFEYVDIVNGCIVSVGNHPCGMVVSPYSIDDRMGLFTTSTDDVPISQINMKEIDLQNYVKLDLLKLDTIELINETCKLVGIERLTPDNVDIFDMNVWNSIREDTTGIFQWEGSTGNRYIKQLMSDNNIEKFKKINPDIDYMTLLSIGNGAIRPAGASYREDLANGIVRYSGNEAIDEFMKPTFGYLVFQEQIIQFLHEYCGYTMGQADVVRRHFAKKTGTEKDIPNIKDGFAKTMAEKYGMSREESDETIASFIQVIIDASNYLFSLNHSQPYSYEGYVSGWLRYYYPLEFLTVCLNINKDKEEKTSSLIDYARKRGITIQSPKFRYSKADYFFDKKENCIYKGIGSIKYFNTTVAEEIYNLKNEKYRNFIDVLYALDKLQINSRQLDILIKINFFREFGKAKSLLDGVKVFNQFGKCKTIKVSKLEEAGIDVNIVKTCCNKVTAKTLSEIDNRKLVLTILKNMKFPETTKIDLIKWQIEFLGYTMLSDISISPDTWIVINKEISSYGTQKFSLYNVHYGSVKQYRVDKKWAKTHQAEIGDVIVCVLREKDKFTTNTNGNFIKTGEKEIYIKCYKKEENYA